MRSTLVVLESLESVRDWEVRYEGDQLIVRPGPCTRWREATPDDIRAAFIAEAEARGANRQLHRLNTHDRELCSIDGDCRRYGREEALRVLGLSALLEPPAPAAASVEEPSPSPSNQSPEPSAAP